MFLVKFCFDFRYTNYQNETIELSKMTKYCSTLFLFFISNNSFKESGYLTRHKSHFIYSL